MPPEARFGRIFATSPSATLATFQGARVDTEAPDWIQLAWRIRPFWRPRTLMVRSYPPPHVLKVTLRRATSSTTGLDVFP